MAIPYAQIVRNQRMAADSFRQAIRVARAELDMLQKELAEAVGVVPPVMTRLLQEPDNIKAGQLRSIIHTLNLDPFVVLEFLGYSEKEIQRMKRRIREEIA